MIRSLHQILALAIIVLLTLSSAACLDSDDDNGDEKEKITVNGLEFTVEELFGTLAAVNITGSDGKQYEGITLSDLINHTLLLDSQDLQYSIEASDGYKKNVTWADMQLGVLVRPDLMTAFPHLPGKYRVRDVVRIGPTTTATLLVNGWLYTWDQPFDKFDEVTIEDNESKSHTGVPLDVLLNDTGLVDPETHNFTIIASDEYSKNFTWEDITEGILVKEERKSVFPEKDKKYWVKDIAKIEVV